jgi:hypothetical protein
VFDAELIHWRQLLFVVSFLVLTWQSCEAQSAESKNIHVIVALCDNRYQGIVPVPKQLGDGDNPATNLYWGAAYGVKTFFKRSGDWKVISETKNPTKTILERCVFQRRNVSLVADAYRGKEIKAATEDFLIYAAGQNTNANLICYVGHNGLMDFNLEKLPKKNDNTFREVIILACASKPYFYQPILQTGANPLLWTTGLMAPESYVLLAAINGWLLNESHDQIRMRAAESYNKYQHCGLNAAKRLFATGW